MALGTRALRVVQVWRGEALEERVFTSPETITIGTQKGCTFVVPEMRLTEYFPLFQPSPDSAGFVLTLAEGMSGKLSLAGDAWAVTDFLKNKRAAGGGRFCQQPLGTPDWGIVGLDDRGDVAFFFQFIATTQAQLADDRSFIDRFFGQALAISAIVHIAALITAFVLWEPDDALDVDPPPSTAIAKILLDQPPEKEEKTKQPAEERRQREKEGGTSKRAAGKEGTVGNPDKPKNEKTVIQQGPRDQIVKKVSNMGALGMLKAPKQSQALKSLLSDTPDATITMAAAGMKGATTVIGHGSGGASTRGEGEGGGGTGKGGQLYGVGDLQGLGGKGRGTGRGFGTGTGDHVGKEMKVSVQTGTPESEGGLTNEQILKVVRSHAAAIQFCYEKELVRFPHLNGKVLVNWKVDLDGRVESASVASSSLGNASAESCIVRQIKNWQFPRPNGVKADVHFPFFFKGQ